MTTKTFWLARDSEPVAFVEDAETADLLIRVHGYTEVTTEPAADRQVHVANAATGGQAVLPYGVLAAWGVLGWVPAGPPAPVDLTKDPVLVDQAVAEPVKPKTATPVAAEKAKN
jgi:hypothetical protein